MIEMWKLAAGATLLMIAFAPSASNAQRAIPDDNLAYPVQARVGVSSGSGFYLNKGDYIYFVTAKHVIQDPIKHDLFANNAELASYSRDPNDNSENVLSLDLATLQSSGLLKLHPSADIAISKIAKLEKNENGGGIATFVPGVRVVQAAPGGIVGADIKWAKRLDEVEISNDIFIFGYPSSIGLAILPQIDSKRPLLRKGIVSGLNYARHTIVIDCESFPGNSGGPVIELDEQGFQKSLHLIGVIIEYVPFDNSELRLPLRNPTILNSGYSIVAPMDFVLELLD